MFAVRIAAAALISTFAIAASQGCAANASDLSSAEVASGHAVNAAAFKLTETCDSAVTCCVGGSEPLLDIDQGVAGGECGLRLYDQGCGGALAADGSVDTNAPVRAVARLGGHWWAEVVCPAATALPSACEKTPYALAPPGLAKPCEASFPSNSVFFIDPLGCTGGTCLPSGGGCGAACSAPPVFPRGS